MREKRLKRILYISILLYIVAFVLFLLAGVFESEKVFYVFIICLLMAAACSGLFGIMDTGTLFLSDEKDILQQRIKLIKNSLKNKKDG